MAQWCFEFGWSREDFRRLWWTKGDSQLVVDGVFFKEGCISDEFFDFPPFFLALADDFFPIDEEKNIEPSRNRLKERAGET